MKVPFLDLECIEGPLFQELQNALTAVLRNRHYCLGPALNAFEESTKTYLGVTHAIGVSSGTDALLLALMGLDIGPGDIVLISPFSFFATAGVVARVGATPAFVDIDRDTFNISVPALRQWLEINRSQIPKVKAVVPVHLYGQCADMDGISELAAQYRIAVVEDAAQAFGSEYVGRNGSKKAGTIGLAGCLSFYPSKNLGALGDAGMLVTDDDDFAARIRLLRNHGAEDRYFHSLIGGNFRMDGLQAAALSVKLPYVNGWNQERRRIAERYDELLASSAFSKVVLPKVSSSRNAHTYHQYTLLVDERRDELRKFLAEKGIGSEIFYPLPFHLQKCFEYLGYATGDFPESEFAAARVLSLPIYPGVTNEMQDYVVTALADFFL